MSPLETMLQQAQKMLDHLRTHAPATPEVTQMLDAMQAYNGLIRINAPISRVQKQKDELDRLTAAAFASMTLDDQKRFAAGYADSDAK